MDDCILLAATIHCETLHHARNAEDTQLDFTAWIESIKPWTDLVQLFAGLGLATVVLTHLKAAVERHRWESFRFRIDEWIDKELEAHRHPKHLTDQDWMIECERQLYNAGFTPSQLQSLLDTAVVVAKGRAAVKIFM